MKIVYNSEGTSICLSKLGIRSYKELSGVQLNYHKQPVDIDRTDPFLVQTVTDLGNRASNMVHAHLLIKEIPDDVYYRITNFRGYENVIHELKDIATSNYLLAELADVEILKIKYDPCGKIT